MKLPSITFTHVPGKETCFMATIEYEIDVEDQRSIERFVAGLREMIPEEDHEQFVTEWERTVAAWRRRES